MPSFPHSAIAMSFYMLVEASGAVPTIDVATTCRASEKAVSSHYQGRGRSQFCRLHEAGNRSA